MDASDRFRKETVMKTRQVVKVCVLAVFGIFGVFLLSGCASTAKSAGKAAATSAVTGARTGVGVASKAPVPKPKLR